MATFRVGQRVRLVSKAWGGGLEGSILSFEVTPKGARLDDGNVATHHSNVILRLDFDPYRRYAQHTDDLEPLYDGNVKTSWNECAWKPESFSA